MKILLQSLHFFGENLKICLKWRRLDLARMREVERSGLIIVIIEIMMK